MNKPPFPASHLRLKRAYEPPSPDDGVRILVDRLWPRGLSKADAALNDWIKDIAPSTELRQWFGHDPDRSSNAATGPSFGNTPRNSIASARWPKRTRSPSSTARMTRNATMPSS